MKKIFTLVFFIFVLPAYAEQPNPLKFERVVGGNAFTASGKLIQLWGVKPPDTQSAYSYAARMYLASILDQKPINCEPVKDNLEMRCQVDGVDVASRLIRMGMATSSNPTYDIDEAYARKNKNGIWKP